MPASSASYRDWNLRTPGWPGTWQATHRDTGRTVDTGQVNLRAAEDYIDGIDPQPATDPTPARVTYTVERGSPARGGHQRHIYRSGEPVVTEVTR